MTATAEKLKLIQDTIGRMTDAEIIAGVHDWRVSARPEQLAPEGDWWTWLFLAGRGAGEHVSAFGGKADIIQGKADIKKCPLMTQSGHWAR